MPKQIPSIGRIVHYKLDQGPNKGQYRPAIIVRVWSLGGDATPETAVQLQVFTDALNDGLQCPHWATSRIHGEAEGQWVWPTHVPDKALIPA